MVFPKVGQPSRSPALLHCFVRAPFPSWQVSFFMPSRRVLSSFTGAVTLACSTGMPAGAQCVFNPPTAVTPGNSAVDLVMNISTAASKTGLQPLSTHASMFYALWLIVPGAVIALSSGGRAGRHRLRILGSIATLLFSGILSCGGVSTGGSGLPKGNQPVTYQITVTGTSAGTAVDAGQSVRGTLVVD